jgi:hypothetical protein
MNSPQFAFGIPMKSRRIAKNWPDTLRVFGRTLRSILRQTRSDFRVFVACHETPDVPELADPRVEVLVAPFDIPCFKTEFMIDKHRKRELIAVRWRQLGGGYLMYVDYDDLVSDRIVAHVLAQAPTRGFLAWWGWDYSERTGRVALSPRFHRTCGTNCAINWAPAELPETLFQRQDVLFRRTVEVGNNGTARLFRQRGEPLMKFPFPAVTYVREHGDNATDVLHTDGWRRRALRQVTPAWRVSLTLREEFGLFAPSMVAWADSERLIGKGGTA